MVGTGLCHGDRAVYLGFGQARGKHCDVLAVRVGKKGEKSDE